MLVVIVKKSKFLKEQETKGLLSGLGLRTSLYQILFLGPLLIYTLNYVLNLCLKCISVSQELHIVLVDHLQKPKKE